MPEDRHGAGGIARAFRQFWKQMLLTRPSRSAVVCFEGTGEGMAPADELGSEAIADHPSRLGGSSTAVTKGVTSITLSVT